MSEILSIEELKKLANPIIEIPNFDNTGTIKIRVQKPKLMSMAAQGKIPNHLKEIARTIVTGKPKEQEKSLTDEDYIKEINGAMELYCRACMVEPTYEQMKDILTDEQKGFIFNWGISEVSSLDNFRKDNKNVSDDSNGKTL